MSDADLPTMPEAARQVVERKVEERKAEEREPEEPAGGAPSTDETEYPFHAYEIGTVVAGKEIEFIYGKHTEFMVYRTTDGYIGWHYPRVPDEAAPLIAEFARVAALGRAKLAGRRGLGRLVPAAAPSTAGHPSTVEPPLPGAPPRRNEAFEYFLGLLGSDLYAALLCIRRRDEAAGGEPRDEGAAGAAAAAAAASSEGAVDVARAFERTWEMIRQQIDTTARRQHLAGAATTTILGAGAVGGSLLLWPGAAPTLLPSLGGLLGAFLSTLQRTADLGFTAFSTRFQVMSEAVLRVLLGLLFGLVLAIMIQAGVALNGLSGNAASLVLAGILAGFFERFVPDLLTSSMKRAAEPARNGAGTAAAPVRGDGGQP